MEEPPSTDEFDLPWKRRSNAPAANVPHLAIAWSLEEPARIGEVAQVPTKGAIFGRGLESGDDGLERLSFLRHRPSAVEVAPPILGARVSRQQLRLSRAQNAELDVESIGRCPLSVNGVPVQKARVKAGDVLTLRNAMILVVVARPEDAQRARSASGFSFAFGEPDEHGIVGESLAAWELRSQLAFTARAKEHVLVVGESGAGKELAARAIHALSGSKRSLTARNAATLPDSLVDAELFGNAKNYPNPGMPERSGLIGEAHGSALFLDEIGELSQTSQAHLLRVLDQEGEYQRLGDSKKLRSEFRLIAATNRDPSSLKHDFLARLPMRLRLPGLNERREDIPLLVRHLLRRLCSSNEQLHERFFERRDGQLAEPRVDPELIELLLRHAYTTHTRELERLLWLALSSSEDDFVCATAALRAELGDGAPEPEIEVDKAAIEAAIQQSGGNVTRATRMLGLRNRYVLYRLMRRFGIQAREG